MKKLMSVITALALTASLLCGCSKDGGTAKEVEDVKKVPVSQIWDGYEELQGQDYGVIKMPDKIEKQDADKLFRLRTELRKGDHEKFTEQFLKAFFGSSYEEKYLTLNSESKTYEYKAPDGSYGYINELGPATAGNENFVSRKNKFSASKNYSAEKDRNVTLNLSGGDCTVGELCDKAQEFISSALLPLYNSDDLPMRPVRVTYIKSKDGKDAYADVYCTYSYKGISFDDSTAPFERTILDGLPVQTFFLTPCITLSFDCKDRVGLYSSMTVPYDPKPEELTELVPLSEAAELLKKELAAKSRYEFEKVSLKYCKKVTAPDTAYDDSELSSAAISTIAEHDDGYIVPMWVFQWSVRDDNGLSQLAIKVNAVTGEITIDGGSLLNAEPVQDSSSEDDTSSLQSAGKPQHITAEAVSYDWETLTYEYEGKTYKKKADREVFADQSPMSYNVINNKYGIKAKCRITLAKNGEIAEVNATTLNGGMWNGMFGQEYPKNWDKEHPKSRPDEVTAKRIKGSIYELSNAYGTATVDLNDMDYTSKAPYPDVIERVLFNAYRFNNGELILRSIETVDDECFTESGNISKGVDNKGMPLFAGIIQSLSDDRAVVLLTDGKTTCDVPTYFNNGKLEKGMNVFVTLDTDTSLYGSGKQYRSEYAVFTVHPETVSWNQPHIEGYENMEHSKIAYAKAKESWLYEFECVMSDQIKQS